MVKNCCIKIGHIFLFFKKSGNLLEKLGHQTRNNLEEKSKQGGSRKIQAQKLRF